MSVSTDKRRDTILARLYEQGRVTIKKLSERLAVSEATVRRDLKQLADLGKLELVYGGASLPRVSDYSFRSKQARHIEAKRAIGRLAAALVRDNDQIFLDSGTTCFEMAPYLNGKRGLTVITNSTRLALELTAPGLETILLGGRHRPDRMDTVGPLALRNLADLRGYKAFIGADGLCMDFGLAAGDMESAHLYAQAVQSARETVLVADHSKFVCPSLHKITEWENITRIVTERSPDAEWLHFLNEGAIDLVIPDRDEKGKADGSSPTDGRVG